MVLGSMDFVDRHAGEIIAATGAAFAWLYHWYVTRFRSQLKDDLEILERYRALPHDGQVETEPQYRALKLHIERSMTEAYAKSGTKWRPVWAGLLLILVGGANFVVENPPSLVSVVVGTLVMALGAISLMAGFARHR